MFARRHVRQLGTQRQLFLDDDIIDELSGVMRRLGPLDKHPANPLLVAENEWEESHPQLWGGAVLRDGKGGYRMWYQGHARVTVRNDTGGSMFNYATSTDGIRWVRPNLGLVEWAGSTQNNIVLRNYDHPNVFERPEEEDPLKRYRMLAMAPKKVGYRILYSADGIRWQEPGIPGPYRDFGIMARDTAALFYDESIRQWVSILKVNRRIGLWPDCSMRRCVGLCTSADGELWDVPELVLAPDVRDDEMAAERTAQVPDRLTVNHPDEYFCDFQNMHVIPYEGLYIGLVTVFDASGFGPAGNQDGTVRVQLVVSRDLRHWTRVADRETFIDLGPMGAFDSHMIIGPAPPVVEQERIRIFYTGCTVSHMDGRRQFNHAPEEWKAARADRPESIMPEISGAIGLATIRRDGFVALQVGHIGGYFRTKHFTFTGDKLILNIDNGAYGRPRGGTYVEIVEPDDTPIAGFRREDCDRVDVDSVHHTVTWNGSPDISSLQDRIIRLKFYCNITRLYAFWFE